VASQASRPYTTLGLTSAWLTKYRFGCDKPTLVSPGSAVTRPIGGGRFLAAIRLAAGYDLETAAARSGISAARLKAIETDQVGPWLLEVAVLARAYGRSVDQVATAWLDVARAKRD
jgi:hypothetical protein